MPEEEQKKDNTKRSSYFTTDRLRSPGTEHRPTRLNSVVSGYQIFLLFSHPSKLFDIDPSHGNTHLTAQILPRRLAINPQGHRT